MSTVSGAEPIPAVAAPVRPGAGPWRQAATRILRNRSALTAGAGLLLIALVCLLAPVYAGSIAHTEPFVSNISGTTVVGGQEVQVLQQSTEGLGLGVTPIGPTGDPGHYLLGADNQGRDVMARLLYGGRNSLLIGVSSALLCCALATVLGVVAGYFGGWIDALLSRFFDVIWAFPVYLLAICLSVVLLTSGLHLGPVHIDAGSLALPIVIIALIYVPYVARPLRGQVMALRDKEFLHAAVGLGASDLRIMRREVLPNILPTVVVFLPLMTALNMLTESALSFLSVGVQSPDASWGTIINDGLALLYTRPMITIAAGLFVALTAVALNVFGDGVRDALDPNARLRGGA
ncbi:peptide/nickel transport system permease protein [Streptosporangium album]|uniref:Peptide/nickel transport system permease protein n=1 Tax=Streptosporangium album TaxID=47479 RepID=A0A7W7RYP1_9ACTN|nr:ABC transporter permease [Streptosporangium album]MBB4940565.1 peptide/nickel transport system permease protein [Streptosporangium album]